MHREKYNDPSVTAYICSFFSLVLGFVPLFSHHNLVGESQVNFSNKHLQKCEMCIIVILTKT